jgi:hypothetical protein
VLTGHGDPRFRDDDGSADPAVAAALSAYATAEGSEHAALTALAGTRLLVPVVAVLTDDDAAAADGGQQPGAAVRAVSGEKASEMALPTLVGRDGRPAIPAFTSVTTLARWQASARPVPVAASQVWRAAVEDSCAVIIDVAGPVPLAVEGARLAALAGGAAVPPPYEDPDVQGVVAAIVARAASTAGGEPGQGRFRLGPAADGSDMIIELKPPARLDGPAAQAFAAQVGSSVLELLGPRLRRGISLALAGSR